MTILPIDNKQIEKNDRVDDPKDDRKTLQFCETESGDFVLWNKNNAGDAWIESNKSRSTEPALE